MITLTPSFTGNSEISLHDKMQGRYFEKTIAFTSSTLEKRENIQANPDATFKQGIDRIVSSSKGLSAEEVFQIRSELRRTELEMQKLENQRLQLGRLLDYDQLRKDGFSGFDIRRFVREDNATLQNAEEFLIENKKIKEYMFGYPANMTADSSMTKHLRKMETELPLMNNCGDPYDAGNYLLDSKAYERALLDKLFEHFGKM